MKKVQPEVKIVLNELKPNCKYIALVNLQYLNPESLPKSKRILYLPVYDVDKAIRFISIPVKHWWQFWKKV